MGIPTAIARRVVGGFPTRTGGTLAAIVIAVAAVLVAGCGEDDANTELAGSTVRLLTHDSFALSDETVAAFEETTGARLEILQPGDAVAIVNRAVLTAGDPEADVLFGVDNNTMARTLEAELFEPYRPAGLDRVPEELRLDPEGRLTPVDLGDVCVNYDIEGLAAAGLEPPETLDQLAEPDYAGRLVVTDPTASTPGLAFLLATIDRYGEDWPDYWQRLGDNGVEVASGWSEAYYGSFSGGSGEGERPLVVSYASSPPAEVLFAAEPLDSAPTGVVLDTCYRQIEFAGVLRGASNPAGARALIDFMLAPEYQADVPLSQFVFPAVPDTPLPEVFVEHAVLASDPALLTPAEVDARLDEWLEVWTDLMAR